MLYIAQNISIAEREIEFTAVRAQGAGGQNVNKVSSAVHLRFDISTSSLPQELKERLAKLSDQRITRDGVVIIKAQEFRSQDKNRGEAIRRLKELIHSIATPSIPRRATVPTRSSEKERLERKIRRGALKNLRSKVIE